MQTIDPQYTQSSASLAAVYLHSILPMLESRYAVDMTALLVESGIDPAGLSDPENLIPFYRVGAFFMALLRETGDQGLGLAIGASVQARSYHVLGYAILSSSTISEAIDRLIRYESLAGKLGKTTLIPGDPVRLEWHCPFAGPWSSYVKEAAIAGWVTFGRALVADNARPLAVYFDHAPMADDDRYDAVFACPVHFNAGWDGVAFAAEHLQQPIVSADPALKALMDQQARERLEKFAHRINLVNEVRAQIAHGLPNGEPSVEAVAQGLGLTARALQNRLKSLEFHFKDLVDDVREQLAYAYLADESTSLIDIAFLLGFAEQSSFSRAFRRWRGCSPMAFRKSLQVLDGPPDS